MSRVTLPAEDCVFRLDSDFGYRQQFPMTFDGVRLSDGGFTDGTITAHLLHTPVYIEVQYDDSHVVVAWASVPAFVTYSSETLTVDCSANDVKRVSVYSRELSVQEVADIKADLTFQFKNETPTTTQQAYIDWEDGLTYGR